MIRSSASCRRFLVQRCGRVTAARAETTTPAPTLSLSTMQPTAAAMTTTTRTVACHGFRHLAMGNSSFSYNSNPRQQQESQQQQQPPTGQTPSQHFRNTNLFSSNNDNNKIQIRTIFVQTENTPNPESIKFLPSNTVRFCLYLENQ